MINKRISSPPFYVAHLISFLDLSTCVSFSLKVLCSKETLELHSLAAAAAIQDDLSALVLLWLLLLSSMVTLMKTMGIPLALSQL